MRVVVLWLLGCPAAPVSAAAGVAGFGVRFVHWLWFPSPRGEFHVFPGGDDFGGCHGYKKCPFRGLSVVEVVVQPVAVVGFTGIRVIVRIVLVLLLHPSQAKRIRVRTH